MFVEYDGSISLRNGKTLRAEKINELIEYIINKFADEKLSMEEANVILEGAKNAIRENAIVQKITIV